MGIKSTTTKKVGVVVVLAVLALGAYFAFKPGKEDPIPTAEELSLQPSEAANTAAGVQPGTTSGTVTTSVGLIRFDAQPVGSKAMIEGTSTIHDWNMESAVIGGYMEVDPKFPESALTDPAAAKPVVQAFMPVRSFKSYTRKMDDVMQQPEHMNEQKHKRIEYKLIELKPKPAASATGPLQFDAVGALTIKGTTRTNTMPVTIEKKDGKIKIVGKVALKMTDFGVKPPAPSIAGMSLIKTGDDITVSIEWLTAPKAQ